ncbi:endonuclease/exonuclease/phosphatase family protein [Gracilibacillus sp. YIM 98692]|uniref:endonuclease/exonuclease/phosphatase family protein n=1 Tax=Gracilibacillus sp. YIM 98692 TaxID=2663532 RepID=UPI0013D5EFAC|nr:endonuclease/exonuclease/phosphatase family protein [Gracilibacillus sp. YIM 98692]
MELKVMTFNLRVDVPEDGLNAWKYRAAIVPKIILNHHPCVFGIQEGLLRMIQDIENTLPEYSWIGEGRRGGNNDEYCAIFYDQQKVECIDSGQFWLSDTPHIPGSISWESDFPRICTWGHFRFKHDLDKEFMLYNTHLDHVSQLARENGIALISENLREHALDCKVPVILTGDLNSNSDNKVIHFLRGEETIKEKTSKLQDTFKALYGEPGQTFHHFSGGTEGDPIDYIFCSTNFKVLRTEVDRSRCNGTYPSDHYLIIATLEL